MKKFIYYLKKRKKIKFKGNYKDNLAELFSDILMTLIMQEIKLRTPKSHVLIVWDVSNCGGMNKCHLIQTIAFVYGIPQGVVLEYMWYQSTSLLNRF